MAGIEYHKNMIYQRVNEATSVIDLIPMLQFLELEMIKNIIKSQIATVALNDTSNIFYSSLSIERILPMDLIQHITSFNNLSNIKAVSNTFHKCYEKNTILKSKEREQEFISTQKYTKNGKNATWVVDKKRTKLNDKEIELKYNGPINNLNDAVNASKNGDKILIYDGKYEYSVDIDKSLQITGCGANVFLSCHVDPIWKDTYFKNIKIYSDGEIAVYECRLLMENCDIMSMNGIYVGKDSALSVVNCNFYGNGCYAICCNSYTKELNVISCMFTGFGLSASLSLIDDHDAVIHIRDANVKLKLKCVDNLFKDNYSHPISRQFLSETVFRDNKIQFDDGDALEFLYSGLDENYLTQKIQKYKKKWRKS